MAEKAHSTPASARAADARASILAALLAPLLISVALFGMVVPDPVASGRAYAVEQVR